MLNIFALNWSVDLRYHVPMTHPNLVTNMTMMILMMVMMMSYLIQISVLPLFPLLFGLVEIMFCVFDLWQTLLVVCTRTSAAALHNES